MKWINFVILIVLFWRCSDCRPHDSGSFSTVFDNKSIRLFGQTRPINYDVELSVNFHNESTPYNGKVAIRIVVVEATDVIILHNKGLVVERLRVVDKKGEELLNSFDIDTTRDCMSINVERLLIVDEEYIIEIDFNGFISMNTTGFYKMGYRNVETGKIV